jgi:hypothetical protein
MAGIVNSFALALPTHPKTGGGYIVPSRKNFVKINH